MQPQIDHFLLADVWNGVSTDFFGLIRDVGFIPNRANVG
jgi:hypothetical protein